MARHSQIPVYEETVKPTPKAEWVKIGDCVTAGRGMNGNVIKIIARNNGLPTVVVLWSSGSTGRHTITTLHRVVDIPAGKE